MLTAPSSPTVRNAPVGPTVPDKASEETRPPETVMVWVPESEQPGEAIAVQVPLYLATPPSLPPRREDDRVTALAIGFSADRV